MRWLLPLGAAAITLIVLEATYRADHLAAIILAVVAALAIFIRLGFIALKHR